MKKNSRDINMINTLEGHHSQNQFLKFMGPQNGHRFSDSSHNFPYTSYSCESKLFCKMAVIL